LSAVPVVTTNTSRSLVTTTKAASLRAKSVIIHKALFVRPNFAFSMGDE